MRGVPPLTRPVNGGDEGSRAVRRGGSGGMPLAGRGTHPRFAGESDPLLAELAALPADQRAALVALLSPSPGAGGDRPTPPPTFTNDRCPLGWGKGRGFLTVGPIPSAPAGKWCRPLLAAGTVARRRGVLVKSRHVPKVPGDAIRIAPSRSRSSSPVRSRLSWPPSRPR